MAYQGGVVMGDLGHLLGSGWPEEVRMTLATTVTHQTPEDLLVLPD